MKTRRGLINAFAFFMGLLLVALLLPAFTYAAPWLVCDYDQYATRADIEIDGLIINGTAPVSVLVGWEKNNTLYFTDPGGATKVTVLYDLASYPAGTHTVRARFNEPVWGVTEWSDPFAPPGRPGGKPLGVRMAAPAP